MYTVKQAADQLQLSPHTIRYYTDLNLIPFVQRDAHGNRLFDQKSLNWLLACKFLRDSGMSIKEIQNYFTLCLQGDDTLQARIDILRQLQEKTQKELEDARLRLACINDKLQHFAEIQKGDCIDDCNPLNW